MRKEHAHDDSRRGQMPAFVFYGLAPSYTFIQPETLKDILDKLGEVLSVAGFCQGGLSLGQAERVFGADNMANIAQILTHPAKFTEEANQHEMKRKEVKPEESQISVDQVLKGIRLGN